MHISKGYDPTRRLDCCAGCRAIYEWPDYNHRPVEPGEYVGFIFHDLRRSGTRNLIRAGVDPTVAKAISGHESDDVFQRYNITSVKDLKEAAARTTEDLKRRREEAAKNPKRANLAAVPAAEEIAS